MRIASGCCHGMLVAFVLAAVIECCPDDVTAQITQAYSFEPDLEGFGPNGGGVTITQDTIGATDGSHSMKLSIVQGATFVGALTEILHPSIGDPPGVDFVLFDLTLLQQFPNNPGDFVDTSITVFGASQPDYPGGQQFGLQVQFFPDNQVSLGGLAVGTHQIRIDLTQATHPLTFVEGTFNEIIGTEGSGINDIIPTGFQIYINKSSTAPWTGYIDNVRIGINPNGDFNEDNLWDCSDINALTAAIASMSTNLAFDMNSDGAITITDISDIDRGWLTVGGVNNPTVTGGRPFIRGDANLDGVVDGQDFIQWNNNKFTSNAQWCAGDFNADGVVDGQDFIEWNTNKFLSSDVATAVPEPAIRALLWMIVVFAGSQARLSSDLRRKTPDMRRGGYADAHRTARFLDCIDFSPSWCT